MRKVVIMSILVLKRGWSCHLFVLTWLYIFIEARKGGLACHIYRTYWAKRPLEQLMITLDTLVKDARNRELSATQRHDAFGEIVNHFQDIAFKWAYTVVEEPHMAQDAVQEAFVIAYQNLNQLRQPKAFAGWFKRIVLSQCHRLVRGKRLPTKPIDRVPDIPAPDPEPAVLFEDNELCDRVMAAIQALPEQEQIVTKMFYFKGYSQKEIARRLQIPLTTVKKRLQYARQNLKGIMLGMADAFITSPQPEPILIPVPVRRR
jgi:RNA polymerase sigma factor (sigma-70 family)